MPRMENMCSHPERSHGSPTSSPAPVVHGRSSSLTNLARLPGVARQKLQNLAHTNPFVRYIEDNDGQDKDENDIYRHKVGRGGLAAAWVGQERMWCRVAVAAVEAAEVKHAGFTAGRKPPCSEDRKGIQVLPRFFRADISILSAATSTFRNASCALGHPTLPSPLPPCPHCCSPQTRCSLLSGGTGTATASGTPSIWPTCSPPASSASCWAPCWL